MVRRAGLSTETGRFLRSFIINLAASLLIRHNATLLIQTMNVRKIIFSLNPQNLFSQMFTQGENKTVFSSLINTQLNVKSAILACDPDWSMFFSFFLLKLKKSKFSKLFSICLFACDTDWSMCKLEGVQRTESRPPFFTPFPESYLSLDSLTH